MLAEKAVAWRWRWRECEGAPWGEWHLSEKGPRYHPGGADDEQIEYQALGPIHGRRNAGEAWRPIDGAPKDGTVVLVWLHEADEYGDHLALAAWSNDPKHPGSRQKVGWYNAATGDWGDHFDATHFMLLPMGPEPHVDG